VLSLRSDVDERCCLLYTPTALISIHGQCVWWQAHISWTVHTTPVWWRVGLYLERTRRGRAAGRRRREGGRGADATRAVAKVG
jgi:hypothetical protein